MSHSFDPAILRAYDIRGVVGKNLSEEDAYHLGRVFALHIESHIKQKPKIAIGFDGRLSSPMLAEALQKGLIESGAEVWQVGLGPTPMLYFAVRHHQLDGGIMVTGSHNPPDHNGFKMMRGKMSVYGDEILELAKLAPVRSVSGNAKKIDILPDYLKALTKEFPAKPLKLVWDAGNGAAGEVVEALCKFPALQSSILLNTKIDGHFPAHHPDPSVPENMRQLATEVVAQKADLGIAFDGDGDRLGIVDHSGAIITGDHLLMILAENVLKSSPGSTIIADVKTSKAFFEHVKSLGGKPIMWKTGHSHIKAKMAETKAAFAGEASGHIFFADRYYGFDDAIYAALRLISLLSEAPHNLYDMVASLPKPFSTPELRIDCDEARKFKIVDEIADRLKQEKAEVNDIDGVRVTTPQGWWLLRASNTQSCLVARCESETREGLAILENSLRTQLKESGIEL